MCLGSEDYFSDLNNAKWELDQCSELQAIRSRDSPVWFFLQKLDEFLDEAVNHIGKYYVIKRNKISH